MELDFTIDTPIGKFDTAPENPRIHRQVEHLDELAANIKTHGVLQPVICYAEKGKLLVTAGRRRLHAARKAGVPSLPNVVMPKADAIAAGLAEQEGHVAMHPADQAVAWEKMWKTKGTTAAAIANAFGVSERTVLQRIALATLHPPILKALASDRITLSIAGSWANAPIERQPALWKELGEHADSWQIARALEAGGLPGSDRVIRFIGEAAYVAAGGRVQKDLFAFSDQWDESDSDGEPQTWWLDREIAARLATEKLQAEAKKLEAQGWGFVIIGDRDYSRYQSGAPHKTKEEKAKAGCFVSISHQGKLDIERGYKLRAGKSAAASKGVAAGVAPKGKQPPMTNTTHERMTRAAAVAVGRALQANPAAALIVLTAQLARMHWEEGGEDVLNLRGDRDWRADMIPELKTDDASAKLELEWRNRLPEELDTLERELQRWGLSEVEQLLAFLVGELVVFSEQSPNHTAKSEKRQRLGVVGATAGVKPDAHWAPDASWFKGCSVPVLDKFAKELGVEVGKTKTKTAEALAIAARDKLWVPTLFREICGEKVEKPILPTSKVSTKTKRTRATAIA